MIFLRLFLSFFVIGAISFGGGYGMISLVRETVLGRGWLTEGEFLSFIAVSESTPGPIGVNMATYVGFTVAGVPGALVATLGLIAPSIIIILIIAAFLQAFRDNRFVNAAFYGLRPASTAMVAAAGVGVAALTLVNTAAKGLAVVNWKALALAAVILVLTRWVKVTKKWHPVIFLLASAVVGVVFAF